MSERILCVDDEASILAAYQRALHKTYTVDVALGGEEALARIATDGPYAVVVADMHMPGMDGVQLLARVSTAAPLTVRMMLTGNSSVTTAIDAVNEGQIFRFLTKPCPAETLAKALEAGVAQYRLLTAERDLLERTLKGAVKVLTDVLSMVNPVSFGRTSRVRRLMGRILDQLPAVPDRWELDVAAMLSQMGCLMVPEATLDKLFRGKPLAGTEARLLAEHARVGHDLVASIPRLESVAAIIADQDTRYDGAGTPSDHPCGDAIPLGARVLKLALDFDTLVTAGTPSARALPVLRGRPGWYDPVLLDALDAALDVDASYAFREVAVEGLTPGMVVAEDVRSSAGLLLIAKGQEITPSLKLRLESLGALRDLRQTLKVLIPPELRTSPAAAAPVGASVSPS